MKIYCVEVPGQNGGDHREWYGTLAEARKQFKEYVRRCEQEVAAIAKVEEFPLHSAERMEAFMLAEEASMNWPYLRVLLEVYEVPTIKADLVTALNKEVRGYSQILECWSRLTSNIERQEKEERVNA